MASHIPEKKVSKNSPKEVFENKLPRYIIGAFSIVAAMAWNEYVKDQMESKIKNKTRAKLLYAITATMILFVAVFVIHKSVDWYMNIKDKTDKVVQEIICHKRAMVKLRGIGHIYIRRVGPKRLIWNFKMPELVGNGRYDVLVNACEPLRLTMMSNSIGQLKQVVTHDWEIDELLGNHLDFKDYTNGPIYSGIISVYRKKY